MRNTLPDLNSYIKTFFFFNFESSTFPLNEDTGLCLQLDILLISIYVIYSGKKNRSEDPSFLNIL